MKNLSIVLVAMIVMLSCSKDNQNVLPSSQNSLSLVIPQVSGGSSNLLLLKDGRTANPVSGIPNFSTMKVGDKLSLSFRAGAVHNGVVDIDVTKVALAQDSVFIPSPPSSDTTSFNGTFTGVAYKVNIADSASSNSTAITSISFNGSSYTCAGTDNGYPSAGSGTFVISNGTITFTDQNTSSDSTLNGSFSYCLYQGYIYFWAIRNGTYYSFSLLRTGSYTSLSSIFSGSFSGVVGYRIPVSDSTSNPGDTATTVLITYPISISFESANKYDCSGTGTKNTYPGAGNGTFTAKTDGYNTWIGSVTFTDAATASDLVLNGTFEYQYNALNDLLNLYATRNGISYSIYLNRN